LFVPARKKATFQARVGKRAVPGPRHLVGDVPVLETALPGAGYTRRVCMPRTQWRAAPLFEAQRAWEIRRQLVLGSPLVNLGSRAYRE